MDKEQRAVFYPYVEITESWAKNKGGMSQSLSPQLVQEICWECLEMTIYPDREKSVDAGRKAIERELRGVLVAIAPEAVRRRLQVEWGLPVTTKVASIPLGEAPDGKRYWAICGLSYGQPLHPHERGLAILGKLP